MHAEGLLHEQAFAAMVVALELELEGAAEDAQGVVVGVERAVDHRGDQALGVGRNQRVLEHTLAGARFAQHQAESALLGVDFEDFEDLLLVGEQRKRFRREGVFLKTEVGADHGWEEG